MKSIFSFWSVGIVMLVLFLTSACERHPASQTIPGYKEKKEAAEQTIAHKKISDGSGTNNAPTFFPQK